MAEHAYLQIKKAVRDLLEPFGHWGTIEHVTFAMLRRKIGARVTAITANQLPAAMGEIHARRAHIEALHRTHVLVNDDHCVRWEVMRPATRRALSDEPGTLEEFEQYMRDLVEEAQARASVRAEREAKKLARRTLPAAPALPSNVILFRPRALARDAEMFANGIVEGVTKLRADRGMEPISDPGEMRQRLRKLALEIITNSDRRRKGKGLDS